MRKLLVFLGLSLTLFGSVLSAQFEITDDAMRDIEDTAKSLDSHVVLKDKKAALAEVQELIAYFRQVEGFYAAKPDAGDGVEFARKTHVLAEDVLKSIEAGNFDQAAESVNTLTRSCKTCHDVYKSN
jgi:soluble cytochrome b562